MFLIIIIILILFVFLVHLYLKYNNCSMLDDRVTYLLIFCVVSYVFLEKKIKSLFYNIL